MIPLSALFLWPLGMEVAVAVSATHTTGSVLSLRRSTNRQLCGSFLRTMAEKSCLRLHFEKLDSGHTYWSIPLLPLFAGQSYHSASPEPRCPSSSHLVDLRRQPFNQQLDNHRRVEYIVLKALSRPKRDRTAEITKTESLVVALHRSEETFQFCEPYYFVKV
jgi:hypothetical protein